VKRIAREASANQFTPVESIDEQLDGVDECLLASTEAAKAASQPGQVETQFSIRAFNGEGLAVVIHGIVNGWPVECCLVDVQAITEAALRLDRFVRHLLDHRAGSGCDHTPDENAARAGLPTNVSQDLPWLAHAVQRHIADHAAQQAFAFGLCGRLGLP
jgi:hypothetical protein